MANWASLGAGSPSRPLVLDISLHLFASKPASRGLVRTNQN